MPTYSIAEAKRRLARFVREAGEGKEVAITRRGKVAAYLRPAVQPSLRQPPHDLVARIMERAKRRPRLEEPAIDIVRRMRDDCP
jgi:prevent-host-death family protein